MGLDINQVFGQARSAVESGMNDVLQMGATAGLGYLEQQAINLLEGDKKQREQAFQTNVVTALQQPGTPGSFGDYLSGLAQAPVVKQYGPYILIGLAVFAVGVVFVTSKGK